MMRNSHIYVEYESIPYGAFASVYDEARIPASAVVQDYNAEELIAETPDDQILAVGPESMATGYLLASKPLTAVRLAALPQESVAILAAETDHDPSQFSLLAWGSPPHREDRTLSEFA